MALRPAWAMASRWLQAPSDTYACGSCVTPSKELRGTSPVIMRSYRRTPVPRVLGLMVLDEQLADLLLALREMSKPTVMLERPP